MPSLPEVEGHREGELSDYMPGKVLFECTTSYLGQSAMGEGQALDAVQAPLKKVYKGSTPASIGWLICLPDGVQFQCADEDDYILWFPAKNILLAAGVGKQTDGTFQDLLSLNKENEVENAPPCFILAAYDEDVQEKQTHVFICPSKESAVQMVHAVSQAYQNPEGWSEVKYGYYLARSINTDNDIEEEPEIADVEADEPVEVIREKIDHMGEKPEERGAVYNIYNIHQHFPPKSDPTPSIPKKNEAMRRKPIRMVPVFVPNFDGVETSDVPVSETISQPTISSFPPLEPHVHPMMIIETRRTSNSDHAPIFSTSGNSNGLPMPVNHIIPAEPHAPPFVNHNPAESFASYTNGYPTNAYVSHVNHYPTVPYATFGSHYPSPYQAYSYYH